MLLGLAGFARRECCTYARMGVHGMPNLFACRICSSALFCLFAGATVTSAGAKKPAGMPQQQVVRLD